MLIPRLLAALVLIPTVILGLFFVPLNYFVLLIILICGLAAWEWSQFLHIKTYSQRVFFGAAFCVFCVLVYYLPIYLSLSLISFKLILFVSLLWWAAALFLVVFYPHSASLWKGNIILKLLFAVFTLVPFEIGMIMLRQIDYSINSYTGAFWLLYLFVLVWATDSGAYFAGRLFGKYKLAPKVSPGKTIEGFIGGVLTSLIVCFVVYYFQFFTVSFLQLSLCSIVAILVSVLGDLTESMFKRESGIKDSGHLIPGHGGILDRIDSLTSAVPLFAFTLIFLG